MLETPKAFNVYHTPSDGFGGEVTVGAHPVQRRSTIGGYYNRVRKVSQALQRGTIALRGGDSTGSTGGSRTPSSSDDSRKTSSDSACPSSTEASATAIDEEFVGVDDLDEQRYISPRPATNVAGRGQRRMSVPEKVFMSADYAILRPTLDEEARFEIVAAFDRFTDPYRRYMQSLTCYDLAPTHSAVVMMDGNLKVHKALTALSQSGHSAAIVTNMERGNAVLTVSDCLRAIVQAAEGESTVAEDTLADFLVGQKFKKWVTANVNTSVWDAARLLIINRVHRLPILQCELGDAFAGSRSDDVLYILTLKNILTETILKLNDPKFSLGPHVKQRTIQEAKIGTWRDIITITEGQKCGDAIKIFFERSISCIPVIEPVHGRVTGILSKGDIMAELIGHPTNYLEVLDIPVTNAMWPAPPSAYGSPTMSILDTISLLVSSDRPSLCMLDVDHKPLAIVSYSDLMDYIQNSAEIHHKMSVA